MAEPTDLAMRSGLALCAPTKSAVGLQVYTTINSYDLPASRLPHWIECRRLAFARSVAARLLFHLPSSAASPSPQAPLSCCLGSPMLPTSLELPLASDPVISAAPSSGNHLPGAPSPTTSTASKRQHSGVEGGDIGSSKGKGKRKQVDEDDGDESDEGDGRGKKKRNRCVSPCRCSRTCWTWLTNLYTGWR